MRENAVLLQQGNVRYNVADIEGKSHKIFNLYNTDRHKFTFDPSVSSLQRFLDYKKQNFGRGLRRRQPGVHVEGGFSDMVDGDH